MNAIQKQIDLTRACEVVIHEYKKSGKCAPELATAIIALERVFARAT